MKSRYDFGTDDQYYEYLVHYYAGQVLCNDTITEHVRELNTRYKDLDPANMIAMFACDISERLVERIKKGV